MGSMLLRMHGVFLKPVRVFAGYIVWKTGVPFFDQRSVGFKVKLDAIAGAADAERLIGCRVV